MSENLLFSATKYKSPSPKKRKPQRKLVAPTAPTPTTTTTTPTHKIFGWGWNGTSACSTTQQTLAQPTRLTALEQTLYVGAVHISAGPFHTLCLDNSGTVFGFGQGNQGQLGQIPLNQKHQCPLPTLLPSLNAINVVSICCGAYHTVLVDDEHRAWSFGANDKGQLGIGALPLSASETHLYQPTLVEFNRPGKQNHTFSVKSCACGFDFTLFVSTTGQCASVGNGLEGQLGLGIDATTNTFKSTPAPTIVPGLIHVRVSQVSAGDYHALFLSTDGRIWSCGKSTYGRLGHGQQHEKELTRCTPKRIPLFEEGGNIVVAAIFAGAASNFIIASSSNVYCWGCNSHGMLGIGHDRDVAVPTKVQAFYQSSGDEERERERGQEEDHEEEGLNVRSIGIGSEHCLFLTWSGNVYGSGNCSQGRLGFGAKKDVDTDMHDPHLIDYFAREGHAIDCISVGGAHSFALVVGEEEQQQQHQHGTGTSTSNGGVANVPTVERTVLHGVGNSISSESSSVVVQGPLPSNEWHELLIRTRDAYGKDCRKGGANVTVSLRSSLTNGTHTNPLTISSTNHAMDGWSVGQSTPMTQHVPARSTSSYVPDAVNQLKLADGRNGTYRLLFHVNYGGRIELDIQLNGAQLQSSPYLIEMHAPIARPVKFIVQEDPSHPKGVRHILAGERLTFQIHGLTGSDELACIDETLLNTSGAAKQTFVVEVQLPTGTGTGTGKGKGKGKGNRESQGGAVRMTNNKDGTYDVVLPPCTYSGGRQDPYLIRVRTCAALGGHECLGSPMRLYVSPHEIDPSNSTIALALAHEGSSSSSNNNEEEEDKEPLWDTSTTTTWTTHNTYKYVLNCLDQYKNTIQGRLSDELSLTVSVSGGIQTQPIAVRTDAEGRLYFEVVPLTAGKAHVVVSTPNGRFRGTPMVVHAVASKSGLDGRQSHIVLEHPGRQRWDASTTVSQGIVYVRCGNNEVAASKKESTKDESSLERYSVTGSGDLVQTGVKEDTKEIKETKDVYGVEMPVYVTTNGSTGLKKTPPPTTAMLCCIEFQIELLDVHGAPYKEVDAIEIVGAPGHTTATAVSAATAVSLDEYDYQHVSYETLKDNTVTVQYTFDATTVVSQCEEGSEEDNMHKMMTLSVQVDGVVLEQRVRVIVLPSWWYEWTFMATLPYATQLPVLGALGKKGKKGEKTLSLLMKQGTHLWTGTTARMASANNDVYCLGLLQAWVSSLHPPFGLPLCLCGGEHANAVVVQRCVLFKLIVDRLRVPLEDEQGVSLCNRMCELRMGGGGNFSGGGEVVECWCKRVVEEEDEEEEEGQEYRIRLDGGDAFELLFVDLGIL